MRCAGSRALSRCPDADTVWFYMCLRDDRDFINIHEKGLIGVLQSCDRALYDHDSAGGRILLAARHQIVSAGLYCHQQCNS